MDSLEPKVYTSTNYSLFKTFNFNRAINRSHMENMIESLEEENWLPYAPIDVIQDPNSTHLFIIDGQHRWMAAVKTGHKVYYTLNRKGIVWEKAVDEIIARQNSRVWRLEDYFNLHKQLGKEEYIRFDKMRRDYNLPISVLNSLCSDNKHEIKKSTIFQGKLKIPSSVESFLIESRDFFESMAMLFRKNKKMSILRSISFLTPLYKVYMKEDKQSYRHLLERIMQNYSSLQKWKDIESYYRFFQSVYNYGRRINKIKLIEETTYDKTA